jgi:hypothetical protein
MSLFTVTDQSTGVLYRQWGPGHNTYGHGWSYEDSEAGLPAAGYIYITTDGTSTFVHEGPSGDPAGDPLIYVIDNVKDNIVTLHPSTGSDDDTATVFLYRGPTGSGLDDAIVHFEIDLQPTRTRTPE